MTENSPKAHLLRLLARLERFDLLKRTCVYLKAAFYFLWFALKVAVSCATREIFILKLNRLSSQQPFSTL